MTIDKYQNIFNKLLNNGYEVYYVGGYVRDLLLNKKPNDRDLVTNATPKEIKKIFPNANLVGKYFGVTLINNIEVATFRKDKYGGLNDKNVNIEYADTLKEDVSRRDLTINSLAMDINGCIYDYYGGLEDIKNKVIRFIGNPLDRIIEDPNRIIRAIRFFTVLDDFNISSNTLTALYKCRDLVPFIAKERIQKEIINTLKNAKKSSDFFNLCYKLELLHYIFPFLNICYNFKHDNPYHKENIFEHQMTVGDNISCKYPLIKLAGYLHDIGKVFTKIYKEKDKKYVYYNHEEVSVDLVEEELKELKFSNEEINYIKNIISVHMINFPLENKRAYRRVLKKLSNKKLTYRDFLRLILADYSGRKGIHNKTSLSAIKKGINDIKNSEIVVIKNSRDLAINGNDIMNVLNLKPSKKIGDIIDELINLVIDNPEKNNKEYLINYLKEKYYV